MDLILYTFAGPGDTDVSTFTTMDHDEADRYARENEYKVIANTYEWADQEVVANYTAECECDATDRTHYHCKGCDVVTNDRDPAEDTCSACA